MSHSKKGSSGLLAAVERIAAIIDIEKKKITNRELIELCASLGIDSLSADPHLCHEIAEVAINHLIRTRYGKELLDSTDPISACFGNTPSASETPSDANMEKFRTGNLSAVFDACDDGISRRISFESD